MPQIHIKLDQETLEKVRLRAKEINYSVQELTEAALNRIVSEDLESILGGSANGMRTGGDRFRFIDLFAGIGGTRIAFDEHGGHCVFSSEWDRWSQKTYAANFGEIPHGDITQIDPTTIPDHDVLVAGFPCQPFSIAGVSKKNSLGRAHGFKDEAQGTLFFNVASIIETKRPRMFLLENVKNLRGHDGGRTFQVIMGVLRELGYEVFHEVLDARNYVPQKRERIFLVGFDRQVFGDFVQFEFPKPPATEPTLKSILEKKVDPRYVLSDHLWSYLQQYAEKHRIKGNGFGFGLCNGRSVARTLSARYYKDGSEILIENRGTNPRRLTPRECARLMGFPEWFKIPVSDTQAYRQFGNSVVVPVVSAIAGAMIEAYECARRELRD